MPLANLDIVNILACPRCHGDLTLIEENNDHTGLACSACHIVYPIDDGIPVMLIDKAIPQDQWDAGTRKAKN